MIAQDCLITIMCFYKLHTFHTIYMSSYTFVIKSNRAYLLTSLIGSRYQYSWPTQAVKHFRNEHYDLPLRVGGFQYSYIYTKIFLCAYTYQSFVDIHLSLLLLFVLGGIKFTFICQRIWVTEINDSHS
jgi:hypothetical protein